MPTSSAFLHRRHLLTGAGASIAAAWVQGIARAQVPVPQQPLELARILIGFAPGAAVDAVTRRIADKLQPGYARSVIVESRAGAGGQVAVQAMKGAPTDGSMILLTPMSTLGVYPHTYKRLPYDPQADLLPVSSCVSFHYGFAVGPAVPANVTSVPQFMEWCRANPSKANFGSSSPGSPLHFTGVLLGRAAGVELTHVGYRGGAPMLTDLMGGTLPACCNSLGGLLAQHEAGKLRVIGTSGATRSRFLPGVPTFTEAGYKDMAFGEWYGLFLPARTPPEVVQRLSMATGAALRAPDVSEAFAQLGMESAPSTPAELAAMLKADTERWGRAVRSVGFTSES